MDIITADMGTIIMLIIKVSIATERKKAGEFSCESKNRDRKEM